jgi:hypothetical protein
MLIPVQLPPGIERNNTPYDTPGQWWDMNLVRWQSGSLVPVLGNQTLTGTTPLTGAVRKIFPYRDNSNVRVVLVGTDSKLYVDQGGYVDITPSGLVPLTALGTNGGYGTFTYGNYSYGNHRPYPSPIYSPFAYWTFANWGQDVILTANSDGRLFYYNDTTPTVAPTVISTAPVGNTAVVVTDERHVMAIGQTGGGGSNRRVAWSSREDYTDWNYASTTNTAGYLDLSVRTPLLKGVKVREGVLIFSMTDIFLATYVGTPYVYSFQRLADTEMFHPDGVATFNGKAVWLSRTGFQVYNGGFVQPLECPILNDIMAEMDPGYGPFSVHACHNGVYPEVWFFYATNGNTSPNRYVIWNYAENWWAWGHMSRTAMAPAEVFKYPYAGDLYGNMYQQEIGYTDSGTSRVGQIYAETGALGLGNGDQTIEIRQVLPATGTGASSLQLEFFTRQTPEGTERTFGPYTPRADGYTDVRVSGRETRVRFVAAQDGAFGIGKMRFDVSQGSGR